MLIPVTILTPFWLAIGLANLDLLMFSELFRSLIIYELCCREPLRRCPILVDRLPEIIASGQTVLTTALLPCNYSLRYSCFTNGISFATKWRLWFTFICTFQYFVLSQVYDCLSLDYIQSKLPFRFLDFGGFEKGWVEINLVCWWYVVGISFDHQLQIEACVRVQNVASYCLSKAGSRQRVDDDRWTSNGQLFPIFGCDWPKGKTRSVCVSSGLVRECTLDITRELLCFTGQFWIQRVAQQCTGWA